MQTAKDPDRERRINVPLTAETHRLLKLEAVKSDVLLKNLARNLIETHFHSRKSNEKS